MSARMQVRVAVAGAVVALLGAACGTGGGGGGGSTVSVTGTNGLAYEPEELTAAAGTVTVELEAGDEAEHTFVVEEAGDQQVVEAEAGSTATGTIELEPGTYTFYCDVPGHREAGMEGTLEVQ